MPKRKKQGLSGFEGYRLTQQDRLATPNVMYVRKLKERLETVTKELERLEGEMMSGNVTEEGCTRRSFLVKAKEDIVSDIGRYETTMVGQHYNLGNTFNKNKKKKKNNGRKEEEK
jgi:hypothetical protein